MAKTFAEWQPQDNSVSSIKIQRYALITLIIILMPVVFVTATEPVNSSKLLPLLPAPPAEWTADQAEDLTLPPAAATAAGLNMTHVVGTYRKGEATATVGLFDAVANPAFSAATTQSWSMPAIDTDMSTKSVTIDGYPGFETYAAGRKYGTLWIMVEKRFFVQIEAKNVEAGEVQAWARRLDLKKLAALK
jgi:hypothetical protein